jgi:hypothetical protein
VFLALAIPRQTGAMFPPTGDPIQPPSDIAAKFDTLIDQFKWEGDGIKSGYGCRTYEKHEGAYCMLFLRCSFNMIGIQNNTINFFGGNFGGDYFLRTIGDGRCDTRYFFSQMQSMFELLGGLSPERAHDIIDTMNRDEKAYRRCHPPEEMSSFQEGRGGLNYGRDGKLYYDKDGRNPTPGERITKIFCWHVKQN